MILVTNRESDDYKEIFDLAREKEYEIWGEEPLYRTECSLDELYSQGSAQLLELLRYPTLYCVCMDDHAGNWEYSSVQSLLEAVAASDKQDLYEEEDCGLSLVIEDANWEVILPRPIRRSRWMNFCVTMDNIRLTQADLIPRRCREIREQLNLDFEARGDGSDAVLNREVSAAIASGDHMAVSAVLQKNVYTGEFFGSISPAFHRGNDGLFASKGKSISDAEVLRFAYRSTGHSVRECFRDVQTVICTGVAGVAPGEHRAFFEGCIVAEG